MEDPAAITPNLRLTLTIRGELARGGRLALSELARVAGEFQANLERVAVAFDLPQRGLRQGRRPTEVVDSVRLDLVAFTPGSAVLELAPHDDPQLRLYDEGTALEGAYRGLVAGLQQLVE